jgi:hypothetical protein
MIDDAETLIQSLWSRRRVLKRNRPPRWGGLFDSRSTVQGKVRLIYSII